jgi:hypothetical protein
MHVWMDVPPLTLHACTCACNSQASGLTGSSMAGTLDLTRCPPRSSPATQRLPTPPPCRAVLMLWLAAPQVCLHRCTHSLEICVFAAHRTLPYNFHLHILLTDTVNHTHHLFCFHRLTKRAPPTHTHTHHTHAHAHNTRSPRLPRSAWCGHVPNHVRKPFKRRHSDAAAVSGVQFLLPCVGQRSRGWGPSGGRLRGVLSRRPCVGVDSVEQRAVCHC